MPMLAANPAVKVSEAVKKVQSIATLPEVTARIIATVEDPKSTAAQLHKIVSNDPALVTRILKVVNSSFYGLPGQIGSVERAIVLLGLNAVKNIAVAASLGQLFRGSRLSEKFAAKDLWTHCVAVAVAARELAKQMKLKIVDEVFLAGMIHDLGILVELQLWPEQLKQVCETATNQPRHFCDIEREVFGVDHQQLGLGLAEAWKFPKQCQLVAGKHHKPQTVNGDEKMLVTLVFLADTLCCQTNNGFNLTALRQSMDDLGLDAKLVDPKLIEVVTGKLDELVKAASPLMG